MKLGATSDLSRLQSMQRQAADARASLDLAGYELTSGEKASRFEATGGNLTRLFSLDRALERNAIHADAINLGATRLGVAQQALGRVAAPLETLTANLLGAVGLGDMGAALQFANEARRGFEETVAVMNTRVAGQALFAGTATGGAALADAGAMLAELDALAAGATTAQDAVDAIDSYFSRAPAGGFFTGGYLGADADLSPVDIGDGARLDSGVRADREEIVSVLRAHAMAAVVAAGAFAGDAPSQKRMLTVAADRMLVARDTLLGLRAEVGMSEGALERGRAERTAEREALDLARAEMLAADPMETGTRFKALEAQLEAIYTVTARLSNLRFVNFMR